jgi:hypothetical protein
LDGYRPNDIRVAAGVVDVVPLVFPALTVNGIGGVSFPLVDTELLKEAATLVPSTGNRDVSSGVWKIDASQIVIAEDKGWETYFEDIVVKEACDTLGFGWWQIRKDIRTKLKGLIIYGNSNVFTPLEDEDDHEPGTFATLLVQLPSKFEGGSITVTNPRDSKSLIALDGLDKSSDKFHFALFFRHFKAQYNPVTNGVKLCLEFDLCSPRTKQIVSPGHATNIGTSAELQSVAAAWRTAGNDVGRLGYRLHHEYTPQSFCFDAMKGRDSIVVQTLLDAKYPSGCPLFQVHLLMMERYIHNCMEYDYWEKQDEVYPRMVLDRDGNKVEAKEEWVMYMDEEDGWLKPRTWFCRAFEDDSRSPDPEFDYSDNDPKVPISTKFHMFRGPGKEEVEPHQGNCGAYVEQWYYAAAVLVSPMVDDLDAEDLQA